jgi:hypothetical protein
VPNTQQSDGTSNQAPAPSWSRAARKNWPAGQDARRARSGRAACTQNEPNATACETARNADEEARASCERGTRGRVYGSMWRHITFHCAGE